MSRRIFCKVLLVAVAVFSLLVLSSVLLAQGRSDEAFERAKAAQERHNDALMARPGVVGTAVGLNDDGQYAVLVLLEIPRAGGIPEHLEGVPVRRVVTGKIYALPKPPSPPGQDKKNPPPAAPTSLTATAVSETDINLDWADNSESDLSHYNVYRSTSSGGPYTNIGSAPKADSPTYSDTGLSAGTYYYVVTAVDDAGKESENSNEASATIEGGPVEPPAAPTDLTATPASSSQIDLSWTDNADNEKGFKIERDSVQIATVGANVTSYSDTGLQASTPYTYQVRAYNDAGDSEYSDEASATTEAGPVNPWRFDRPVPIGVSTGHPDITAGTIGCRVTDGTYVYALSNNHVYANENLASIEDPVIQPGTYDGGSSPADDIGTLAAFEPIVFHPRANNMIDAAIAEIIIDDVDGEYVPRVGNATPDGYGTPSSETAAAELGLAVQKYGRTTGLTTGEITGINATLRVHYDSGLARFIDQILIGPGGFSAGGDSGSLIVTDDDFCNPVGLLFAGSDTVTVANPIDVVLGAFGITIDGE